MHPSTIVLSGTVGTLLLGLTVSFRQALTPAPLPSLAPRRGHYSGKKRAGVFVLPRSNIAVQVVEDPIVEARRRAVYGTLTHAQSVKLMRRSRLALERIEMFFISAEILSASEHLASFPLDTLAASGDVPRAKCFFNKVVRPPYNVRPTALSYCILLKAHGRVGDRTRAMKNLELPCARHCLDALVDEMQDVVPDIVLVNALVDAYVRCGAVDEAARWLDIISSKVKQQNPSCMSFLEDRISTLSPNVRTFNAALKGLARQGEVVKAFGLMRRMKDAGVEPTAVTEAALVHTLAVAGKVRIAIRRLRRMVVSFEAQDGDAGRASTAAYTVLLRRTEKPEDAFRLVDEMCDHGVCRNTHTYAELLVACSGNDSPAYSECPSCRPDAAGTPRLFSKCSTYTPRALRGLPAHRRELLVTAAWRRMLVDGVTPTDVCYTAAISAYLEFNDATELCVRRAFSLFSELRKKSKMQGKKNVSILTLNSLIDGLARSRDFENLALALFSTAATASCQQTSTKVDEACDLPSPDLTTYSIALRTLGRRHDARRVEVTWKAMSSRFQVDILAFNVCLDALLRCNRLEDAIVLLGETAEDSGGRRCEGLSLDPDVVSYSTVVRALATSSKNPFGQRRALLFYNDCRRKFCLQKLRGRSKDDKDDLHRREYCPDVGLVRAVLVACAGLYRTRTSALFEDAAVRAARRILDDAKTFLTAADYKKVRKYAKETMGNPNSPETWKDGHDNLIKKSWNVFESGFRIL
mmetsp:Transcript_4526/g.14160  ORF Transcript_4526/g.14160 Transcript_4526/m.14160 type:complete len:751 (-) Transcript_4526:138-2390(-)